MRRKCPCGGSLKEELFVGNGYWGVRLKCDCGYERSYKWTVKTIKRSRLKERVICKLFGHQWQQSSPLEPNGRSYSCSYICLTCGKQETRTALVCGL